MKLKLLAAVAGVMLIASPALAASTTVEFADKASGNKIVVTFDDAGMATGADGSAPVPYTLDQATKTLCSTYQDQPVCITFDAIGDQVGFKTPYKDDKGNSGVATITAKAP